MQAFASIRDPSALSWPLSGAHVLCLLKRCSGSAPGSASLFLIIAIRFSVLADWIIAEAA